MYSDTPEGREFITELSEIIVSKEAPEEMPLFDELTEDYFEHPDPQADDSTRDDPLGFGLEGMVVAVTPAVVAMVTTVLVSVIGDKLIQEDIAEAMKRKLRELIGQEKEENGGKTTFEEEQTNHEQQEEDKESPQLTESKLKKLEEEAIEIGIMWGLKRKEAKRMAKAIVESYVLAG